MYPITKQQIQDSYNLVKSEGKTDGEAVLVLFEIYNNAFGLASFKFRQYLLDAVADMESPEDAFDRAMNIIT